MLKITALLALASAALAVPAPSSPLSEVGSSLTRAFEQSKLARRQTLGNGPTTINGALAGLEDTLGKAVNAPGNCASACSPWVSSLQDCVASNSAEIAIGRCACRSSPVQDAQRCGECFGGADATNVDNFANLCRDAVGGGVSTLGTASRTSSGFAAASSAFASASSRASSPISDAVSELSTARGASVTNSGAPAATSPPASSAGQIKIGGAALLVAGAVAMVM